MHQAAFEPGNPALTRLKETCELREKRRDRLQKSIVLFQLVRESAANAEPLRGTKRHAQVGAAADQAIERGERLATEAARESLPR
jgi:hypothetical protein